MEHHPFRQSDFHTPARRPDMEKIGMTKKALALFIRYFHLQELIFVLSLMALACLPIALSELIRGAGTSLLLPLTLYGSILAWASAVRR